jgi:hypothetical protein
MKPMLRLMFLVAATVAGVASPADAAPKKYHFDLAHVAPKPEVKPDAAKAAQPRVEAKLKETFTTHPQLVGTLDGAPDWKTQAGAYRKFLAKKGISGAYHVTVDISEASEELQPIEGRPKSQRLVVRVAIHMLGERMPSRTMGFTGDGQATIKVEIGKKLNEADRKYAWDEAAKAAIDDAMKTVFKQLAVPPKKQ